MSPLTLTPQPSWKTQVGLGKESTWNTPVPDTAYLPVEKPKFEDVPKWLYDRGLRGHRSKTFGLEQGVISTVFELPDMKFYPDDSGHFLMAILGTDNITGTTAPYTHTLTQLDGVPPSYTLTDFSGLSTQARQYAGCYIDEVTIKYTVDGDLTIAAKGQGSPSTLVAKPSATYSTQNFLQGWEAQLTLAAQVNARVMGGSYTIRQKVTPIFGGNNQQGPTTFNVDGIEVTGQFDVEPNDETEFLYMLQGTVEAASLKFTSGTNSLTLQTTKTQFTKGAIDRSGDYVKLPLSFETFYNATDSGAFTAILANPRATQY